MLSTHSDKDDRYTDEDFAQYKAEDWQPARIATDEHVMQFHKVNPRAVTQHAGQIVRVRRNADADRFLKADRFFMLGCSGEGYELHSEDAARLFPHIEERVSLCSCYLLMD